jgi:hypothetical protein
MSSAVALAWESSAPIPRLSILRCERHLLWFQRCAASRREVLGVLCTYRTPHAPSSCQDPFLDTTAGVERGAEEAGHEVHVKIKMEKGGSSRRSVVASHPYRRISIHVTIAQVFVWALTI